MPSTDEEEDGCDDDAMMPAAALLSLLALAPRASPVSDATDELDEM